MQKVTEIHRRGHFSVEGGVSTSMTRQMFSFSFINLCALCLAAESLLLRGGRRFPEPLSPYSPEWPPTAANYGSALRPPTWLQSPAGLMPAVPRTPPAPVLLLARPADAELVDGAYNDALYGPPLPPFAQPQAWGGAVAAPYLLAPGGPSYVYGAPPPLTMWDAKPGEYRLNDPLAGKKAAK